MGTVYAIHEPTKYDRTARRAVAMDLSPATEHGEIKIIFPGVGVVAPRGHRFVEGIRPHLGTFSPEDFLLMAGDLELVVWAAILIKEWTGQPPRLLKWNGREGRYVPVAMPATHLKTTTNDGKTIITSESGSVIYEQLPGGGVNAHVKEIIK